MPRCIGKRADGSPCQRIVGASQSYCFAHDPSRALERRRNASKAGRSSSTKEIRDIKWRVLTLAKDVENGAITTDRANTLNRLFSTYLKAVDFERRVHETDELAAELAELRKVVDGF